MTGEQGDLLALIAAPEQRDAWWFSLARTAIVACALTGGRFSIDDVHARGVPEPAHPNHWGVAFKVARQTGLIEPAGFTVSTRESRRGGVVRLWVGVGEAA